MAYERDELPSRRTEPKHTRTVYDIPDEDLIKRVIRNLRHKRGAPRWVAVADAFGLGSTYSMQLCRRFDLEPDEIVKR